MTFGRQSSTDTGTGLPSGSNQRDHPSFGSRARQLLLPASGGIERIGAFYCEAQKDGITERIPAIIMAANSKSSVVISHVAISMDLLCDIRYVQYAQKVPLHLEKSR